MFLFCILRRCWVLYVVVLVFFILGCLVIFKVILFFEKSRDVLLKVLNLWECEEDLKLKIFDDVLFLEIN